MCAGSADSQVVHWKEDLFSARLFRSQGMGSRGASMSDIVERLRRMTDMTTTGNDLNDISRAADEIEGLRQKVAGFTHLMDLGEAEIKRLRTQLTMAQGCSALASVGIDAHSAAVKVAKDTMAKLIVAEKEIDRLRKINAELEGALRGSIVIIDTLVEEPSTQYLREIYQERRDACLAALASQKGNSE